MLAHDDGLRDVAELAGEVPRVGGLERGIREALPGAVGGREVLENIEALAEVRADGRLDDLAAGLGHQAPHARELLHLGDVASGARVAHEVDGVEELGALALLDVRLGPVGVPAVTLERVDEDLGELLVAVTPDVEQLVVALALGDDAVLVVLLDAVDALLGGVEQVLLLRRDAEVGDAERETRDGGPLEADRLHVVEQVDRRGLAAEGEDIVDHAGAALLAQGAVVEGHALREDVAEKDPPHRRDDAAVLGHRLGLALLAVDDALEPLEADRDGLVDIDRPVVVGEDRLVRVLEPRDALLVDLLHILLADGDEVDTQHDVLRRADDRPAVRRAEDVVRREHEHMRLGLGLDTQRQVDRHLVAVEVSVEPAADERVQADRVALHEDGLEGLDAHAVERRGAVEHDRVLVDDLLENVPHLRIAAFEHPLGALDGVGEAVLLELADDEGLVELEGDLLGQAALVELELGAHHDHGTGRVVDALAQQVLAEAALLALDHVRQ